MIVKILTTLAAYDSVDVSITVDDEPYAQSVQNNHNHTVEFIRGEIYKLLESDPDRNLLLQSLESWLSQREFTPISLVTGPMGLRLTTT